MSHEELRGHLESHYRRAGWTFKRAADGTLSASGIGGVTWYGLAVTDEDLVSDEFQGRLETLSDCRMPGGELCPLDLLPDPACEPRLNELLEQLRLNRCKHISVFSFVEPPSLAA